MAALRSARLEALLGARLEQVDYAQLMTLVSNQIAEAFDLDFKSELYGSSDRAKRDAATDVAALANTAGGLLILGIEEDDQARARAAPGVALSDAEERRIRQVVGSNVVPMPVMDVLPIEDPDSPGRGLMLIAVPRSPLAPHAVLVSEGLRYPKRNGATTRYLSEPEVADAYRARFALARQQESRAREIETEALARLATTDDQAWIVVSLVPDLAGQFVVDQANLAVVRDELLTERPFIIPTGLGWTRVSTGRRRLLADGASDNGRLARYLSTDLHEDGAGVFAVFVLSPAARQNSVSAELAAPEVRRVSDESIVNGILSGLRFLASHARDRSAAGGNALVRAQLYPVSRQQPLDLGHYRNGFSDRLGTRIMADAMLPAERAVPLDSLVSDGPALVSTAYLLATDVFQEFGWAEAAQLTRDGGVRVRYWRQEQQPHIRKWAEASGVSTNDETLPG